MSVKIAIFSQYDGELSDKAADYSKVIDSLPLVRYDTHRGGAEGDAFQGIVEVTSIGFIDQLLRKLDVPGFLTADEEGLVLILMDGADLKEEDDDNVQEN